MQPRALVGGNLISAIAGVAMAQMGGVPPTFAAAVAVALAIAGMSAARCLHPPSGAVALTAVLGGPHVLASGYWFVLVPVLLNTGLLLAVALTFNGFSGRSYPHVAHPVVHPAPLTAPVRLMREDYEAVIADYGERLAIGPEDLGQLFEELTARYNRAAQSGRSGTQE